MYKRNPLLLSKGLGPAAEVGRALNKSLSTIHRLFNEGKVGGQRDGKALYIDLVSLSTYFRSEGNTVLADAATAFRSKLLAEAAPSSKRAAS